MNEKIRIGQLNNWIEVFQTTKSKSPTGQSNKTDVLFKKIWSKTDDINANEKDGDKVFLFSVRSYVIRFDSEIYQNGEHMFIRDFGDDYNITGVKQIGNKEFLELRTLKRE